MWRSVGKNPCFFFDLSWTVYLIARSVHVNSNNDCCCCRHFVAVAVAVVVAVTVVVVGVVAVAVSCLVHCLFL